MAQRFTYTAAPARRRQVIQVTTGQGYSSFAELSALLGVSEMTIRRDAVQLVQEGRLRGFPGGVGSLSQEDRHGWDYSSRMASMSRAKRAIAERAGQMVTHGSVVALDAGTTTARLARELPESNVHVVTHSYAVADVLASNPLVRVSCLGGVLDTESLSFAGPTTLSAISDVQVDTLFLAATGLSARGAYCRTGVEAIIKRALIAVADRVVLVSDSSKFAMTAMMKICGWDAIDTLVVDSRLAESDQAMLADQDVEVVLVGDPVDRD